MITPQQIIDIAAADMNDSAQRVYKWTSLRPYMNMALMELMQIFEENNLPITSVSSHEITVPVGETQIAYTGTTAQLPPDLIEIEDMWESNDGGNSWSRVVRRDYIDPNLATGQNLIYFAIYVWRGDRIEVPQCTNPIRIRLDYVRNLIPLPLTASQNTFPLPLKTPLFLGHKTAALCAALTAQDETRAGELSELADQALAREINIPIKAQQKIPIRRRPFRSGYKLGGRIG